MSKQIEVRDESKVQEIFFTFGNGSGKLINGGRITVDRLHELINAFVISKGHQGVCGHRVEFHGDLIRVFCKIIETKKPVYVKFYKKDTGAKVQIGGDVSDFFC